MEKKTKYQETKLSDLIHMAEDGDVRAALQAGKLLYDKCVGYHQRCVDNKEDPASIPEAADDFLTAEKWLTYAYDNAGTDKIAQRAAMYLSKLYDLEVPSPIFSEEKSSQWLEKEILADVTQKVKDTFERIKDGTALVRKQIYEQAEKKSPEAFREIGETLLAGYDDVVTPDKWKTHGYGTAGDTEMLRYIFEPLFNKMLDTFYSESICGYGRIHEALNLLNADDHRHIEAALVEAGHDDIRDELHNLSFFFEDITQLSNRDTQVLLRNVSTKELALALKISSPALRNKFYGNMSMLAVDNLEDEIDYIDDFKQSDVLTAQNNIRQLALRLAKSGNITIPSEQG